MFLCYLFIDKLQGWNERGRERERERGKREETKILASRKSLRRLLIAIQSVSFKYSVIGGKNHRSSCIVTCM